MRQRQLLGQRLTLRSIVVAAAPMLLLTMSLYQMEAQSETRVYSIKPIPGDSYTHSGASYRFYIFWHQPGWYYGHLQYNGIVGIHTLYPRSGNGSCYFETPDSLGKSDIEFRYDLVAPQGYWGRLGDLEWLSYEWLRDSRSTVPNYVHLPIRIYVGNLVNGRIQDRGYLIYERVYNYGAAPVPTDVWVFEEVVRTDMRVWQNPIGGGNFFDAQPFSVWQSPEGYQPREGNRVGVRWNAESVVFGISIGAGSGWSGRFIGAVDNVQIRFRNGVAYHFNFEVRPVGDINGDGIVDDADLLLILQLYGQSCSGCPYDPNEDGIIDDADLLIVLMHFGNGG